jgi:8-oxo-dGTP pyrophosphatase MutT (NUDIX family)
MQTKYVGCMLITPKDEVLLIRYNANGKKKDRGKWGNPGGKIEEKDENDKESMIRELREETKIEYYKLDVITEKNWLQCQGTIRIFSLLVKEIPDVFLSEEHDLYIKTNIKNLHKFNLTYSYKKAMEIYNNLK